jgi:type VI protein secretion system component VasK
MRRDVRAGDEMKKKTRLMIGILCCAAALGEVWNVLHIISTRAGTPLLAPWLAGAALGFIIFTSVAVVMFRAAARINAKETGSNNTSEGICR